MTYHASSFVPHYDTWRYYACGREALVVARYGRNTIVTRLRFAAPYDFTQAMCIGLRGWVDE